MMSTLQTPDLHTEIEVFLVGWVPLLTACLVFVNVILLPLLLSTIFTHRSTHTSNFIYVLTGPDGAATV